MDYPDAHCHVDVLKWNLQGPLLLNSKGIEDWDQLCRTQQKGRRSFIGLHPWKPEKGGEAPDALERLEVLLKENPGLAVGEIGLDGGPHGRPEKEQRRIFRDQCALALLYQRPVSLHLYKCWEWFWKDIEGVKGQIPVLIHGFTGSPELGRQLVKKGFFLSLSPRSFRKGEEWIREILRITGVEPILIESDYDGGSPLTKEAYQGLMESQYRLLEKLSGRTDFHGYTSFLTD